MGAKKESPAIDIFHLTKHYLGNSTFALKDLNIQVFPGEVYGFLGPNGAGKSTTIKILMNFLQPTAGAATINSLDIIKDSVEAKNHIGYLAGDTNLFPKMTGRQLFAYLRDINPNVNGAYLDELIERLGAEIDKKLKELSRGNRQKIAIIQAFMHKPSVLILDEPTSGLDPLMQEVFFDLVREAKERGSCIFLSSHILSEVQKICDRVGIIKDGKLVKEYSMDQLLKEVAHTFDITFLGTVPTSELQKISGLKILRSKPHSVTIHMTDSLKPLFKLLSRFEVSNIDARNLDLEGTFMHFYRDEPPGKEK